jgi:RNA polymerase sigma-70 factor (ECF subfamily)
VDENELQAAFEAHGDKVYRFVWRMTNSADAAEDVSQEVFVALLRRPDAYHPARGSLAAFLIGIARHLVLKRWRDERSWEPLDDEGFMAEQWDFDKVETVRVIAEAVQKLPPLQREVLVLAQYEELPLAEIALAVDCELGTVKARLARARENLRRMLRHLKETPEERSRHGTVK